MVYVLRSTVYLARKRLVAPIFLTLTIALLSAQCNGSLTFDDNSVHLLFDPASAPAHLLLTASAISATSISTAHFDSATGTYSAIIYAAPGSPIPTSLQMITTCPTCDETSDVLAHLVFTPAPDLYSGQSYSVELIVGASAYSAKTNFGLPSGPLLASWGWPSWPFGGGTPPSPPTGPAVPPPVVPGPIALPALPPGAALPPGMPATVGEYVVRQGILLGRLRNNALKCALINAQIALLTALPCKTVTHQRTLEAWLFWAGKFGC